MKTITSVSLSGGQGKSTLIYFLSRLLARRGFKTLVIDLDPQHNISTFLRVFVQNDEASVFEFLKADTLSESIYPVPEFDNLFLIPADDGLEVANDYLAASGMGILKLRSGINLLRDSELDFDFCLIDTPPQKSQLCMTGIGASDFFLIPAEPEVKGVLSLNRTIAAIDEIVASGVVTTQLLGVLPFRDKWFGLNRSQESSAAIEQMAQLVDPSFILPSFRESTIPKKAIASFSSLTDLGKPDLEYPFEQLLLKLEALCERHLSTVR
ncbi:MAG: ParA family protein [Cyanobacteria bacterium J06600_6]